MPIYNEDPILLEKAINSVLNINYPREKIHLWLAFDDSNEPEAYLYIVKKWKLEKERFGHYDIESMNVSILRLDHGGKKSAQKGAYNFINKEYSSKKLEESLLFFIDSDIQLDKDCLLHFNNHMDISNKYILTGLICCVTSENRSFLECYQDIEYVSGQIFWRNLESYCGATSCLPGAFTMMKYNCFSQITDKYFDEKCIKGNSDYQRFYLGEDRYLTHLLMKKFPWTIGYTSEARCKTNAPDKLMALMKQRRRWYLGHISNDTWMISSLALWRNYPIMCLFNLINNTRSTSIYIYLLYFTLLLDTNASIYSWLGYVLIPLALSWVFIIVYSIIIKRRLNSFYYLIVLLFQPILSMLYMYYTIYTMNKRTWGGVRVEQESNKILDIEKQYKLEVDIDISSLWDDMEKYTIKDSDSVETLVEENNVRTSTSSDESYLSDLVDLSDAWLQISKRYSIIKN